MEQFDNEATQEIFQIKPIKLSHEEVQQLTENKAFARFLQSMVALRKNATDQLRNQNLGIEGIRYVQGMADAADHVLTFLKSAMVNASDKVDVSPENINRATEVIDKFKEKEDGGK